MFDLFIGVICIAFLIVLHYVAYAVSRFIYWGMDHPFFFGVILGLLGILGVSMADGCGEAGAETYVSQEPEAVHSAGWLVQDGRTATVPYAENSMKIFPAWVSIKERISPVTVCKVQNAIRFQEKAWSARTCEDVAKAINSSPAHPITVLAIMVLESDMRVGAIADHGDGVYDVGLMGVRCVLSAGVCSNGFAEGFTLKQLAKPEINIWVGAHILTSAVSVRAYNGQSKAGEAKARKAKRMTYVEKVAAIEAAIEGVRVRVRGARMRKLTVQISAVFE